VIASIGAKRCMLWSCPETTIAARPRSAFHSGATSRSSSWRPALNRGRCQKAALAPLVVSGRRRGLHGELAVERVVPLAVISRRAVAEHGADEARAVDVAEVEQAIEALSLHPLHDGARGRAAVGAVADRPEQRPARGARGHVRTARHADRRLRAPRRPGVRDGDEREDGQDGEEAPHRRRP